MNYDLPITIDLTYLHTVTGGDKDFEKTLLEGAVNDIQLKVDNLEKAWNEQDAESVRSNAHSLKSLTAIAGIPHIEKCSKTIDNVFADGTFHSNTSDFYMGIINGWSIAKPKLYEVIKSY
jgi:HPt (histidine-containing phosphotransfer) domain-containing protein